MFEEQIAHAWDVLNWKLKRYEWARETIEKLELGFLLSWTEATCVESVGGNAKWASPNGDFEFYKEPEPSAYMLTLYIPMALQERITGFHQYINRVDGPKWKKSAGLTKHLWGRKGCTTERYVETYRWRDGTETWLDNAVHICFYRDIGEGDQINGCTVTRRKPTTIKGELTIECAKEKADAAA